MSKQPSRQKHPEVARQKINKIRRRYTAQSNTPELSPLVDRWKPEWIELAGGPPNERRSRTPRADGGPPGGVWRAGGVDAEQS